MSKKLIVVTGATGIQGGSVARVLLKTGKWDVRAVTRNPDGDKAKELKAAGASVVSANFDDEASLHKAFEGAHAIFAVTNFWEMMFMGQSAQQAGAHEAKQAFSLATAASKISTLEHYIWSTLGSADKRSGGKHKVAHLDYKAEVDERIKKELPDLAKKTTFLWVGWYSTNFVNFPNLKPTEVAMGQFPILLSTFDLKSTIPTVGDMQNTPGIFVRQILEHPDQTAGKYVHCKLKDATWEEQLADLEAATGKKFEYVRVPPEQYVRIYGPLGQEIVDQFEFGNSVKGWEHDQPFVSADKIGIDVSKLPTDLDALKSMKAQLW